jgi:uncharacterized protein (TIGR02246 family)
MRDAAFAWKFLLTGLTIALAGLSVISRCQTKGETDQQAVSAVIDRFMDAWNRHDAKAFAAVFAEDADFTNWRGEGASGRSNIEAFHAPVFATIFKNSHQSYSNIKTRFIRSDVAVVDVHWEMTGATDAQGNPRPDRHGLLSFTMAKNAAEWQIVVMHNLDLTALPPSNSGNPATKNP